MRMDLMVLQGILKPDLDFSTALSLIFLESVFVVLLA